MSLHSLIFNVSNEKEIATFIAHLDEEPYFVVIRNAKLKVVDASAFVGIAYDYLNPMGFSVESMLCDEQYYNFPHEIMRVILDCLLCEIEEKSQG
jgi:hypothetical protein